FHALAGSRGFVGSEGAHPTSGLSWIVRSVSPSGSRRLNFLFVRDVGVDSAAPLEKEEYLAWRQNLEDDKGHTLDRPTVFRWTGPGKEQPWEGHHTHNIIVDLPMVQFNKFYVDGTWTHDPAEPVVTNQLGTVNNVIQVKKTDFEVFDAVMMDSQKCSSTLSPPGPCLPILPPHLLQVILNKHTGISDKLFAFPHQCDPALLPEPNHVMLNHLYSLSIKDGVMVLSATYRYKKKYVTTLMYKPVWARVLWLYKPVWPVACGCISLSDQWPVAV
uniref:5'-AMP-activated protein kinase subunit beta-1 n=1 Tax=Oncorhynchus mykiss TaxID=8022 RepID=A0A8K9X2R8_ONCMY